MLNCATAASNLWISVIQSSDYIVGNFLEFIYTLHVAEDSKADCSPHITLSAISGLCFACFRGLKADSSPHFTLSVISSFRIILCMLQRIITLTAFITCCRGGLLYGLQPIRDKPTFWSCCCLMGLTSTLEIKRYLSNLLLSCFLLNVLGLGLMILRGLIVKTGQLVDLEQTALERQDLSQTCLALHELESKFIVSIIYV